MFQSIVVDRSGTWSGLTYFLEVVHHGVETGDLADVVADQEEQTARQVRLCAANHRIVEKEIEH